MQKVDGVSLGVWPVGGLVIAGGYIILSLADMAMSSVAFVVGIPEVNPLLAWLAHHGLFVPGKILLTAVVGGLIAWLYPRKCGKAVGWVALMTMVGVNLYHLWGLSTL